MEDSDAALVARVRAGDAQAANRLLERYLRACRAVALAITGSEADADDACQDGFVAAMEQIDSCRDPARFGGWLLQIVRNRARNLVRQGVLRVAEPLESHQVEGGSSPAAALERSEVRGLLVAALTELPETHREVVLLHDLEGWKHAEIADKLGLAVGTVRSHLHHARRRLRRILTEEPE
ncbi:MAG TPA: sigma-70 family RNA polymerase sigma factor [Gemmatimonadales bacterium]|nr:sigma-70 family RNA polymerase sigma factor [Gemmatimonadales bacterium]